MIEAEIINALLRCTREDSLAQRHFELVREDLGLWVMELPESFSDIVLSLKERRAFLKSISEGGADYTLHIAAKINDESSLRLPVVLAELSADCGFTIEVVGSLL